MNAGSAGLRWLISITVFLTGGAVMVVELLGVRLISPVYGTGLHVWAALISVALDVCGSDRIPEHLTTRRGLGRSGARGPSATEGGAA